MKRNQPGKKSYYLVHGLYSTLFVILGLTAIMIVCFSIFHSRGQSELSLFVFAVLGPILLYALSCFCKIIEIGPDGVRFYSLKDMFFIPWKGITHVGVFFHYINLNSKRKFYYFSRKPVSFTHNPLPIDAMPTMKKDFLFVMDQKGLERQISRYLPSNLKIRQLN